MPFRSVALLFWVSIVQNVYLYEASSIKTIKNRSNESMFNLLYGPSLEGASMTIFYVFTTIFYSYIMNASTFQMQQLAVDYRGVQNVMAIDDVLTSHPVYVPVSHPNEINEIFDLISYAKVRLKNRLLLITTYC